MTLELKANLAHYGAPPTWNCFFGIYSTPSMDNPDIICVVCLWYLIIPRKTLNILGLFSSKLGKKHYFICHNYSWVKSLLLIANVYYFGRWEKDRNPSGCFFSASHTEGVPLSYDRYIDHEPQSDILGMSSSQLTFTPSFFRGVGRLKPPTRNEPSPIRESTLSIPMCASWNPNVSVVQIVQFPIP